MQRYYTTIAKSSSLYSDNNSVSKCVFAYVFPLISLCILLFLMATIRANGRHHTRRCRRPSAQMVAVKKYHVLIEPGNTHYKFIRRCYIFLSDNKSFTSHESHESHKDCIAKGSQLSALPSVYEPDGKHERSKCSS